MVVAAPMSIPISSSSKVDWGWDWGFLWFWGCLVRGDRFCFFVFCFTGNTVIGTGNALDALYRPLRL